MDNSATSRYAEGKWPRWTERVREIEREALEVHIEDAIEQANMDYSCAFGVASQKCESPIEALFLAAFIPYSLRDPAYSINPQERIGDYRADFVVSYSPAEDFVRKLVVECDGHDYHERTKEQAERDKKRDRAISAAGMPVFRFTGRELHRDPQACVEEIIDYTQTRFLDEYNERFKGGR